MNDQITQLIRTLAHAAWGSLLGLTVVDDIIRSTGLDAEWVKGVAVTLSVAIVVFISQRVPNAGKVWTIVQTVINIINKPPAYQPPAG